MKKTVFLLCMLMGLWLLHAQSVVGPARVTNDDYGFTVVVALTVDGDTVKHAYSFPGSLVILSEEDGVTKLQSDEALVHGGKSFKFLFLTKRLVRGKNAWYVITSTQLIEVESK